MRKILVSVALIITALATVHLNIALANSEKTFAQWNAPAVKWHNYEDGLALAKKTRRPICVVFQTSWCPHCVQYRKLFFNTDIVKRTKNMVMILVDRDLAPEINAQYAKYGKFVPRTMALNWQGKLNDAIRGPDPEYPHFINYDNTRELAAFLDKVAAEHVTQ